MDERPTRGYEALLFALAQLLDVFNVRTGELLRRRVAHRSPSATRRELDLARRSLTVAAVFAFGTVAVAAGLGFAGYAAAASIIVVSLTVAMFAAGLWRERRWPLRPEPVAVRLMPEDQYRRMMAALDDPS